MERELTHDQAAEFLGAYALDAVEVDERDALDRHLNECPRCRAEVADHRRVASFLGSAGGRAPDGLWDRIAGSLEEAPPELKLAPVVPLRERRAVSLRVGAVVAGVAAAVIALLGLEVVHLNRQVDHLAAPERADTALLTAATHALADPRATRVSMRSADGGRSAEIALAADGTGFLVADDLPALAVDRTYQLWALANGQKISAGVLGARPGIVAFHYAPAGLSGFAVTDEQAGGVVSTQNAPVLLGTPQRT
ncbi:MAG: anti-sigma factor [Acidimicrobiia bacterium]|nr:anti-sigma factor [Acidimicrobiia bacterium]